MTRRPAGQREPGRQSSSICLRESRRRHSAARIHACGMERHVQTKRQTDADSRCPMVTFTQVLCPTDLSEASRPSLTYAAAVARRYGAGLTVLHAVPPFGTLVVQSGEAGSSMPMVFPPIDDVTDAVRAFAMDALAGPRCGRRGADRRSVPRDRRGGGREDRRPDRPGHTRPRRLRSPAERLGRGEGPARGPRVRSWRFRRTPRLPLPAVRSSRTSSVPSTSRTPPSRPWASRSSWAAP